MKTTPEELLNLRKKKMPIKDISNLTGLSERVIKNRIHKLEYTDSPVKTKSSNLTPDQKKRVTNLHYFGYTVCEIVSETGARPRDVKIFISDLPVHPEIKKESA